MPLESQARAWLELIRSYGQGDPDRPTVAGLIATRSSVPRRDEPSMVVDGLARIEDVSIPIGGDSIRARVYTPIGDGPFPLHVFFHGGAFVFGSPFDEDTDTTMQLRAAEARTIVVSVDYRLAPEHRFPVGVEDAYASVLWTARGADDLGGDRRRISVGGVSSGGNFAAAVALMARDRHGPRLVLQLLEVPGTDLTKSSRAWREGHPDFDTTRTADLALLQHYLRTPLDQVHPYASPLLAPDLSNVAPAYIMSAEMDPRRDESEAYAARLGDAGVEAVARTMHGHFHASMLLMSDWDGARSWAQEANRALARANGHHAGRIFAAMDAE